ncbi:hypothetical protein BKG82_27600 [Mycobacteroides chelonae]|uniref:Uncharacterized protein n=1 Tax=Mycobacteroides chelonae TaxID=1774 RepID=A0A1S1LI46_MYCCH|nr:hypothetical protein BKG82_27600 [Mycobacteroides chelonae]
MAFMSRCLAEQFDDFLAYLDKFCALFGEHLRGHALLFTNQTQKQMLSSNMGVAKLQRFTQAKLKYPLGALNEGDRPRGPTKPRADNLFYLAANAFQ